MINPWEWCDHFLWVRVKNYNGNYSYLLNHVNQDEFFELYVEHCDESGLRPNHRQIMEFVVQPLTTESYEIMEQFHPEKYKLE
jgi:hypothetical protein